MRLSCRNYGCRSIATAQGFTLVELVAAITIIAVLAAVAGPKFIGRDVFEVRGAQGTLLAALRYAQKTAVAQRTKVYLSINSSTHVICLGYTTNCSTPVIDPSTQAAYSKTWSADAAITASVNPLGFDGLGKPVPNASAQYTIQNNVDSSQPSKVVNVEADTGYVR